MAGGERRLQILRVAMRLFSQHGFRGTTTKEIAAAAGVSEAMVLHHSLNNNLWGRKRSLLKISNQAAAREFAKILLHGVAAKNEVVPPRRFKSAGKTVGSPRVSKGLAAEVALPDGRASDTAA